MKHYIKLGLFPLSIGLLLGIVFFVGDNTTKATLGGLVSFLILLLSLVMFIDELAQP